MWDVSVCVACLATDVRMYSMSASSLLQPYQLLAGIQMNDGMPQKLCWECAALVNKFNLFRDKCERAYLLLQDIYIQHDEIMEQYVQEIDREQHNLSSSCSIAHIPSYTLNSRSCKVTKDTRREPVVTPPVKHEFEIQMVKPEYGPVKSEPDFDFDEPVFHMDDYANREETELTSKDNADEVKFTLVELSVKNEKTKVSDDGLVESAFTQISLNQEQANELYKRRKNSKIFNRAKYKCELCYQGYQVKAFFKKHMSRHDPTIGPYECDICKMRFETRIIIRRHMKLKHTRKYNCNICKKDLSSRDVARQHFRLHERLGAVLKTRAKKSRRRVKERVSADEFEAVERLLTQEQMMQAVRDRQLSDSYKSSPLKCALCFKGFLDGKSYKNHMLLHDPMSGNFECDVCKLRMKTRRKIRAHVSSVHLRSFRCKLCPNISYIRGVARAHYQLHTGVKHMCHVCGSTFSKNATMVLHMHAKHPSCAVSHVCGECGSSCPSEHGLRDHKRKMHQVATVPEENAPYCEECKVQFASRKAWTKHVLISKSHEELKKDIVNGCRHCGEAFPSSVARRRHVELEHPHRTVYKDPSNVFRRGPQPCALCGETMQSRRQYWGHFRRAHPGEIYPLRVSTKHVCELCGKHFKCNSILEQHRVVHTDTRPHQCGACPKAFYTQEALKRHHISHSDYRPFPCALCRKSFKIKSALDRHLGTHTGEKPYVCGVCAQAFTSQHWMQMHVRKVHNKEHIPSKPRVRRRRPAAAKPHRPTGGEAASLAGDSPCDV